MTQRMLGHSDPKLTARVYTHLEVEDLRAAVEGPAGATSKAVRSVFDSSPPLPPLAAVGGSGP